MKNPQQFKDEFAQSLRYASWSDLRNSCIMDGFSMNARENAMMREYANQFKTKWVNTQDELPNRTGNILLFIPESDEGKEEIRMYYFVIGMKKIADGCYWTYLPEPPCE